MRVFFASQILSLMLRVQLLEKNLRKRKHRYAKLPRVHCSNVLIPRPLSSSFPGWILPEVDGGGTCEEWKVRAPKVRENSWAFIQEKLSDFLLNNALVYKFLVGELEQNSHFSQYGEQTVLQGRS